METSGDPEEFRPREDFEAPDYAGAEAEFLHSFRLRFAPDALDARGVRVFALVPSHVHEDEDVRVLLRSVDGELETRIARVGNVRREFLFFHITEGQEASRGLVPP